MKDEKIHEIAESYINGNISDTKLGGLTMKTRQQYLSGECNHREYYAQFVDDNARRVVEQAIGKDKILQSIDPSFNDIPLSKWNSVGMHHLRTSERSAQMKACGDYMTLAGLVCIAKEAARQIKDANTN